MTSQLIIASAQMNAHVGHIQANMAKIRTAFLRAKNAGADILILPEQFIIGYPAEDLVLKPTIIRECRNQVLNFACETRNAPAVLFSLPWQDDQNSQLYVAMLCIQNGKISHIRYKHHLPNYGVFDETRLFKAGPLPAPVTYKGIKLGLTICEDLWQAGPAQHLASQGAELLISANGSPWHEKAETARLNAICADQSIHKLPILYVNQVGGQDELVFDGTSFAINGAGEHVQRLESFAEDFDISTWQKQGTVWQCVKARLNQPVESKPALWDALCLGLTDYVLKNNFERVILGLSGGIDSALVATLAVDALGPDRVWCVMMPSQYTSRASLDDAQRCAHNLTCRYDIIPIDTLVEAFSNLLSPLFSDTKPDISEENIQSRCRAVLLMALSNKFNTLLLSTGNKSEMAVGYATLYGDMCGGYNPIKDIYKSDLYALAHWRNSHKPAHMKAPEAPIPASILSKPPSAELRANQKDSDSLPDYEALDFILKNLIENECSIQDIIRKGAEATEVEYVQKLLYQAEYKRRQAPIGPKISTRNFGRDRRYPITHQYSETLPSQNKRV